MYVLHVGVGGGGDLMPSWPVPRATGLCRGPDQLLGLSYLPSSRPSFQQIHPPQLQPLCRPV